MLAASPPLHITRHTSCTRCSAGAASQRCETRAAQTGAWHKRLRRVPSWGRACCSQGTRSARRAGTATCGASESATETAEHVAISLNRHASRLMRLAGGRQPAVHAATCTPVDAEFELRCLSFYAQGRGLLRVWGGLERHWPRMRRCARGAGQQAALLQSLSGSTASVASAAAGVAQDKVALLLHSTSQPLCARAGAAGGTG